MTSVYNHSTTSIPNINNSRFACHFRYPSMSTLLMGNPHVRKKNGGLRMIYWACIALYFLFSYGWSLPCIYILIFMPNFPRNLALDGFWAFLKWNEFMRFYSLEEWIPSLLAIHGQRVRMQNEEEKLLPCNIAAFYYYYHIIFWDTRKYVSKSSGKAVEKSEE